MPAAGGLPGLVRTWLSVARSAQKLAGAVLAVVAVSLLALARLRDPGAGTGGGASRGHDQVARPAPAAPAPAASAALALHPGADHALHLPAGDPARAEQMARVIESMDASGHPPAGVAQGGRRHGPRGGFDNAQGQLPRRAPGYYTESDLWPRGRDGRGAERLVFGREREVYYTADHYRTFLRVR